MIAVVVPVHNEEARLGRCLASLLAATRHPRLCGEEARVVVVLDRCTDASARIAEYHGVAILRAHSRTVGVARAIGARWALRAGARWIANTDGDSVVASDWLACQLELAADAVCGRVRVHDWAQHHPAVRQRFERRHADPPGARRIHGANLGVSARAYFESGGFAPLATGEDVALVDSLEKINATISWSDLPRVYTSARLDGRAPGGFAGYIGALYEA